MKKIIFSIALLISFVSFSQLESRSPKINLKTSLGINPGTPTNPYISGKNPKWSVDIYAGLYPEWTYYLSRKWEIGFGPTINFTFKAGDNVIAPGGTATLRFDFKTEISGNKKFYIGSEGGLNLGYSITRTSLYATPIGVINMGAEFDNGLTVGAFAGYGKGTLGIELGYRSH